MKVLNLYAGIGGNRKLWQNVEVTAVEHNAEIAAIYHEYYPNDTVIIHDAHEYLLDHYKEFDFIWSSPPCPTHSRLNTARSGLGQKMNYPSMVLYEEIIFLQNWYDGKFVIENVIPYYEPLITPTAELDRHLFWANFKIYNYDFPKRGLVNEKIVASKSVYGFNISDIKINHRKDQILRNLVNPEIGLYLLELAQGIIRQEKTLQQSLFAEK